MRKIVSVDAETDGLWGNPFAVAAIVYADGVEAARFTARLHNRTVTDSWTKENVLPTLDGSCPVTHEYYHPMLRDFTAFYMAHKEGAEVIAHMGYIVEAHLFREMHRLKLIGDWDAPFPLFDVSGNLQAAGFIPTSVDTYAKEHGFVIGDYGTTHNPLYDAEVAAHVYMHLTSHL